MPSLSLSPASVDNTGKGGHSHASDFSRYKIWAWCNKGWSNFPPPSVVENRSVIIIILGFVRELDFDDPQFLQMLLPSRKVRNGAINRSSFNIFLFRSSGCNCSILNQLFFSFASTSSFSLFPNSIFKVFWIWACVTTYTYNFRFKIVHIKDVVRYHTCSFIFLRLYSHFSADSIKYNMITF